MAQNDSRGPSYEEDFGDAAFLSASNLFDSRDNEPGDTESSKTLRPGPGSFTQRRPSWFPQEGELLAGRYRVEQRLGRTGHEIVLLARRPELGHRVVLRCLSPEAMELPEIVMAFQRSARKALDMRSEHAERVLDFGRLGNGCAYRVAELPRGPSLDEVLAVRGALPVEEAVDTLIMACEAVAEAHAVRLVYRNLGTSSLFVERRSDGSPLVKLVDFGVLDGISGDMLSGYELALPGASSMTRALPYIAPEQIRNPGGVDQRADIWALGGILYELLAGRPPFRADTSMALLAMIAADSPSPLRGLRPDVPQELADVVAACLEKDVVNRPQSIGELVEGLAAFASPEVQIAAARIGRVVSSSTLPPVSSFAPGSFTFPDSGRPSSYRPAAQPMSPHQGAHETVPYGTAAPSRRPPRRTLESRTPTQRPAPTVPSALADQTSAPDAQEVNASPAPVASAGSTMSTAPTTSAARGSTAAPATRPDERGGPSRVGLIGMGVGVGAAAAVLISLATREDRPVTSTPAVAAPSPSSVATHQAAIAPSSSAVAPPTSVTAPSAGPPAALPPGEPAPAAVVKPSPPTPTEARKPEVSKATAKPKQTATSTAKPKQAAASTPKRQPSKESAEAVRSKGHKAVKEKSDEQVAPKPPAPDLFGGVD